jgi:hypothetical protein
MDRGFDLSESAWPIDDHFTNRPHNMTSIAVSLASGDVVDFDVDAERHGPINFVFSVRKCGSSVFNEICRVLAEQNQRRFLDVGDRFFRANVREDDYLSDPALLAVLHPGNIYGGFRSMPAIFIQSPLFRESPRLLMVRDPRDAIVSEYFSMAYSHPLPAVDSGSGRVAKGLESDRSAALELGIEAYVKRRAGAMRSTMLGYASIAGDALTTILKYEDYVFAKRSLIELIVKKFEWRVSDPMIADILGWADVHPEVEQPRAFIRKVTPGDHREKLTAQTISEITETLRPAMDLFGYQA